MEKPLTETAYDLSAAAVQNVRNKDFYLARLRGTSNFKKDL